jgi:hypothetical protein
MTSIILSSLDRYARENGETLVGPPADFVREMIGADAFAGAHIRHVHDTRALPANTTHVLCLGEAAMKTWMGREGLDAWRGYVELTTPRGVPRAVPTVATYLPIDCVDVKDYEGFDGDDDDDEGAGNNKDTAPTARGNYRFWFMSDVAKLYAAPRTLRPQTVVLSPTHTEWQHLMTVAGSTVYFDIETHPATNTLQCFSLAVDDGPVLTVGVYDWTGRLIAPANTLEMLALLFSRNRVVIHNASFDLPFLAVNYRVPFGRDIHDTMVIHHRCFPEAEKSLAHVISYWINSPYHKGDAGTFHPRNRAQYDTLLLYNARDVHTLREVHRAQMAHVARDPGLAASVELGNRSLYSYLVAGLHGFYIDLPRRLALIKELERRVFKYQMILDKLVGRAFNAGSPKQCIEYFHEDMGYPVVKKSKLTGGPSVAGDALYLLLLAHPENPVPRVILAMRDVSKQLTQLQFKPLNFVHTS